MHGFMLFGRGGKVSYIEGIQKIHVTHICSVNDFLKEKKRMFFFFFLICQKDMP